MALTQVIQFRENHAMKLANDIERYILASQVCSDAGYEYISLMLYITVRQAVDNARRLCQYYAEYDKTVWGL